MQVWLRLMHLFGLPEGDRTDNLMRAALGPVLRVASQDIVDAALPEPIARLVQELALRERAPKPASKLRERPAHVQIPRCSTPSSAFPSADGIGILVSQGASNFLAAPAELNAGVPKYHGLSSSSESPR
jgi:hypothetical protein